MVHAIPFQLDKQRAVRMDAKAIMLIERELGKSFFKIDLDDLSMTETINMLWAGLQHEDKELTVDDVADLVAEHSDPLKAVTVVIEAIGAAFEQAKGKPGNGRKGSK